MTHHTIESLLGDRSDAELSAQSIREALEIVRTLRESGFSSEAAPPAPARGKRIVPSSGSREAARLRLRHALKVSF